MVTYRDIYPKNKGNKKSLLKEFAKVKETYLFDVGGEKLCSPFVRAFYVDGFNVEGKNVVKRQLGLFAGQQITKGTYLAMFYGKVSKKVVDNERNYAIEACQLAKKKSKRTEDAQFFVVPPRRGFVGAHLANSASRKDCNANYFLGYIPMKSGDYIFNVPVAYLQATRDITEEEQIFVHYNKLESIEWRIRRHMDGTPQEYLRRHGEPRPVSTTPVNEPEPDSPGTEPLPDPTPEDDIVSSPPLNQEVESTPAPEEIMIVSSPSPEPQPKKRKAPATATQKTPRVERPHTQPLSSFAPTQADVGAPHTATPRPSTMQPPTKKAKLADLASRLRNQNK